MTTPEEGEQLKTWPEVKFAILNVLLGKVSQKDAPILVQEAILLIQAHKTLQTLVGARKLESHFTWRRQGKEQPTNQLGAFLYALHMMKERKAWGSADLRRCLGQTSSGSVKTNVVNPLLRDGILREMYVYGRSTYAPTMSLLKLYKAQLGYKLQDLKRKQQQLKSAFSFAGQMIDTYHAYEKETFPLKSWFPERSKLFMYFHFQEMIETAPPNSTLHIIFSRGSFFETGNAGELCMRDLLRVQVRKRFKIFIACDRPDFVPKIFQELNAKIYKKKVKELFGPQRFLLLEHPDGTGFFIWLFKTPERQFRIEPLRDAPQVLVEQISRLFD